MQHLLMVSTESILPKRKAPEGAFVGNLIIVWLQLGLQDRMQQLLLR